MSFDVERFSAEMGGLNGFQNPSKFRARAFSPHTQDSRFFEWVCESVQVPGLVISASPVRVLGYGAPVDAPLVAAYGEASLSCYLDNDGVVQDFFTKWQQSVINYNYEPGGATSGQHLGASPFQVGYAADYSGQVIIETFTQEGTIIRTVTLHAAWPKAVGQIQHGWGDKDRVTTLPVQMAYRSWTSSDMGGNDGTPS